MIEMSKVKSHLMKALYCYYVGEDNDWRETKFYFYYFIYFVSRFDGTSDWLFQLPWGIVQTAYKQIE